MKTKIVAPTIKKDFILAKDLLSSGHLVAFPTETVYGLGAIFDQISSVKEIFRVKKRPQDNPLIVHVGTIEEIYSLVEDLSKDALGLIKRFFPGPLTLILKKKKGISLFPNLDSIAIRMPDHPVSLELLRTVKKPLVAPSANLSGKPSPTRAKDVLCDFNGKIPLILDGGKTHIGIESTVLSLLDEKPILLRPGIITKKELEKTMEKEIIFPVNEKKVLSPGMKYRHYAPSAQILTFQSEEEIQKYVTSISTKKRIILSCKKQNEIDSFYLSEKNLFPIFREADEKNIEEILILCDQELKQREGLWNRIQKAMN